MQHETRHDLGQLPYSPTVWQRIGGPWSLTLRAYLWTSPLAIFTQPLIEQSFWDDYGTWPKWFLVSVTGYLVFGLVLWLGRVAFVARGNKATSSTVLIISIAIVASMCRSATIGIMIDPLGLTGVDSIARLPFGVFLGFAWIFTSALVMDYKYRFRLHLASLVDEQKSLLVQNQNYIEQLSNSFPDIPSTEIEKSHRDLQQELREIAIISNDKNSIWSMAQSLIKRTSIRVALVSVKEFWTSEKNLAELQGSRTKAFQAITKTPLMNVPIVMIFTGIIMFLGSSRLYSLSFSLFVVIYGIVMHVAIIESFKAIVRKLKTPSSFGYIVMLTLLPISSLLSTNLVSPEEFDLLVLRTLVFAATGFEIVWIIATGFFQYSQQQRQLIINQAGLENERLEVALNFWQDHRSDFETGISNRLAPLATVAGILRKANTAQDQKLGCDAMEFSNVYFSEHYKQLDNLEDMSIETELKRISNAYESESEVIWTVTGAFVKEEVARKAVAALEICISQAIRHSDASVISIEVKRLRNCVSIKVTDNGQQQSSEDSANLGVAILQELSENTWQRDRAGGLNIVTAQFS